MGFTPEAAWNPIKRAIDTSELYHGVATIIWHNIFMWARWGDLYEKILQYGKERGAWMAGGAEITKAVSEQI